jgi:hypothetical protein
MTKLGLTINESKTSLKDARRERFVFLGYSFGPHNPYKFKPGVRLYMSANPSKKSVQRLKAKVGELLGCVLHSPQEKSTWAPAQFRWRLRNSRILRVASVAASSLYSSQ